MVRPTYSCTACHCSYNSSFYCLASIPQRARCRKHHRRRSTPGSYINSGGGEHHSRWPTSSAQINRQPCEHHLRRPAPGPWSKRCCKEVQICACIQRRWFTLERCRKVCGASTQIDHSEPVRNRL